MTSKRPKRKSKWPLLLAALLAWYELDRRKREDEARRIRESRWDLRNYQPR